MPTLLALLLFGSALGLAQAPPKRSAAPKKATPATPAKQADAPKAWPIASLAVDGNRLYSQEQILKLAGLRVGQVAGKDDFEAARDRLLASGAFDSVGYRFAPVEGQSKFSASFQVSEVGQVFPYKTDQLPGDPKALADAIRRAEPLFQDKMPATEPVLKRVSKLVESELAKSGKSESVSGQVSAEEQGTLMIVFRPSTLPSVAEVKFEGNKAVPTAKLQLAVVGVAVGALWSEPRFQTILDASVRPVYEEMGRIRVSFPKLVAEPAKDVKGLIVTVTVNEGEVYKLRNVELTGAADPRPLLKEAKFSTEEVANFTEIGNSVEKIRQNLKRNGYLKVQTAVERKIDDKAKTVDLLVKLTPGPQFHFGKLKIEGLDIQTEPHVRKLWAMKPGQAYNYEYADVFLSRIRQDGMFDNLGETKSVPTIDEAGKTVDVTLLFHSDGRPAPAIGPAQEEREKRRRQPGDGPPL